MVEDHVQDDADVVIFAFGDEAIHIGKSAVLGIYGFVVGDVIAEVNLGRGVHGSDPDGVYSKLFEVAEAFRDAVEIAYTVTVRILEGAG